MKSSWHKTGGTTGSCRPRRPVSKNRKKDSEEIAIQKVLSFTPEPSFASRTLQRVSLIIADIREAAQECRKKGWVSRAQGNHAKVTHILLGKRVIFLALLFRLVA